jgi:radical SAM protein with 4Fe4S-binding SPASM domain
VVSRGGCHLCQGQQYGPAYFVNPDLKASQKKQGLSEAVLPLSLNGGRGSIKIDKIAGVYIPAESLERRCLWRTNPGWVFLTEMIISSCGDLIGCEKMIDVPGMTIGNIRRNTLSELWRSPEIDKFISNIRNTEDAKCRKCGIFAKCRTGCFAAKNYFVKPIFGTDPRCEIR